MRILLVDGDQSEGVVLAGQLGERGHEVVRCFPPEGHTLCVGASDSSKCPVESLGCDVALIVRDPESEPGLREMGAVCAIRRHIPVIEACAEAKSPFATWATPAGSAVIEAVEAGVIINPIVISWTREGIALFVTDDIPVVYPTH